MAAITGESIFGSGKESSTQARQKAVLVKAAKLGIKTKGMRLLKHDEDDAMRMPRVASRTGTSARHPSPTSEPRWKETKKRQRHAESGRNCVDDEDRWRGNGTRLDVGPVDVDESAGVASVPVRLGQEEKGEETVVVSKKRRRRGSRPRTTSAAAASSSNDGLAAIASIY